MDSRSWRYVSSGWRRRFNPGTLFWQMCHWLVGGSNDNYCSELFPGGKAGPDNLPLSEAKAKRREAGTVSRSWEGSPRGNPLNCSGEPAVWQWALSHAWEGSTVSLRATELAKRPDSFRRGAREPQDQWVMHSHQSVQRGWLLLPEAAHRAALVRTGAALCSLCRLKHRSAGQKTCLGAFRSQPRLELCP